MTFDLPISKAYRFWTLFEIPTVLLPLYLPFSFRYTSYTFVFTARLHKFNNIPDFLIPSLKAV